MTRIARTLERTARAYRSARALLLALPSLLKIRRDEENPTSFLEKKADDINEFFDGANFNDDILATRPVFNLLTCKS